MWAVDPSVTVGAMTQDGGAVTISYTLANAPAVVTFDIVTNGASIGGRHLWRVSPSSDVWKKVTADGVHTITWHPEATLADAGIDLSSAKAVVTAWPLRNTPDYMVVDISTAAQPDTQRYYPSVEFLPGGLLDNLEYRTSRVVMRKIQAKGVTWTMGTDAEYEGKDRQYATSLNTIAREAAHEVTLTNNYYMGVFPVTQAQFNIVQTNGTKTFRFRNPLYAPLRPADTLTFNHIRCAKDVGNGYAGCAGGRWPNPPYAQSFLGILRTRTGLDFDLPGEAQWEWACRAGNGQNYWGNGKPISSYNQDPNLPGRYSMNGGRGANGTTDPNSNCATNYGTQVVGSYEPNAWGLYDMHGNVGELCLDWYEADISAYNGRINVDPAAPMKTLGGTTMTDDNTHVARGGSFYKRADGNRSAQRDSFKPWDPNEQQGCRLYCQAGLE